jgi:hypothetical protein
VDQTFPRSVEELELVRSALGTFLSLMEEERCTLLLTDAIRGFILKLTEETFDWSQAHKYPRLGIIYSVLGQFGLQQHGVLSVDVSSVSQYSPHPLPDGVQVGDLGVTWSDEVGRLFTMHSARCSTGKYFIGIACTNAFAGGVKGTYDNPQRLPAFPLVGPQEVNGLDDSFAWEIPANTRQVKVTFREAFSQIHKLGGTITKPKGSSHYQVRFQGERTWPLDYNLDPIPDDFLRELVPITKYSLELIKYVLVHGKFPRRKCRLSA